MKTLLVSALALGLTSYVALAEESGKTEAAKLAGPVELTPAQLDKTTAGVFFYQSSRNVCFGCADRGGNAFSPNRGGIQTGGS